MSGDAQEPKRAMSKDEIDELFNQDTEVRQNMAAEMAGEGGEESGGEETEGAAPETGPEPADLEGSAAPDVEATSPEPPPDQEPAQAVEFGQLTPRDVGGEPSNIDLLLDVKLPLAVELGRNELPVKEILDFGPGSIVELNRMASEPVDLLVNGVLVARGEVVVIEDHFGVRLTSLISPEERIRSLGGTD